MRKILRSTLIANAISILTIGFSYAGPCSREIAKIEEVMRDPGPFIGPTNPQSLGARLHEQPTQTSVAHAIKRADARYFRTMARARALNAKGDPRCMSVVRKVEDIIGMK